jgi:hypothetical protein
VPSLYDEGWQQGSLFKAELPISSIVVGEDGEVKQEQWNHGEWVIASQDCTLAYADVTETKAVIEIRPVHRDDPPAQRGIRSHKLLLEADQYIDDSSPHVMISPTALMKLHDRGVERATLADENRRVALKLWLGKRYDRPAVPDVLVPLARRLAREVERKRYREQTEVVRDVLFRVDTTTDPPHVRLYAIVEKDQDVVPTRQWLGEVALAIPSSLGIVDEAEAGTSHQFAISVLEDSYSADVTDVTWKGESPTGAF